MPISTGSLPAKLLEPDILEIVLQGLSYVGYQVGRQSRYREPADFATFFRLFIHKLTLPCPGNEKEINSFVPGPAVQYSCNLQVSGAEIYVYFFFSLTGGGLFN